MSTLNEMLDKIDQLKSAIAVELPKILSQKAGDAKAKIVERIQERGQDAQGNDLKEYTPLYQKLKEKKGRYRGHVDLTLSGRMLANIGVVDVKEEGPGKITVIVGGRDTETQKKLSGNADERGDILALSPIEKTQIEQDISQRIGDLAIKILK